MASAEAIAAANQRWKRLAFVEAIGAETQALTSEMEVAGLCEGDRCGDASSDNFRWNQLASAEAIALGKGAWPSVDASMLCHLLRCMN